ncbi:Aste57867_20141 [Aphanomyces stellatus]|uniref:Aste57867_20141 protein n=1 Tax=Aphanomyces stellatus TaxID=120398 RepID=A0A485LEW7_9STRA|nr:hypothetical protein As57867_020075 [Aphanomyces stellatus]VFT96836.1 Aste57867_20141 [Aphanomyces stellatus]
MHADGPPTMGGSGSRGHLPPPPPPIFLSVHERYWIDWSIAGSSILSAAGCLYILIRFCTTRKHRDATSMLVATLAAIELVVAVAKAPATLFAPFDFTNGVYVVNTSTTTGARATLCQVQAFFIDVSVLHAVLWNGCMAYNLRRWVIHRDVDEALQNRFWVCLFATSFFCLVWTLSAALPLWTYQGTSSASLFGFSQFFCWVKSPQLILYRFVPILVIVLVYIVTTMVQARRVIRARACQHSLSPSSSRLGAQIQRKLLLYVLGFIVLYTPITVFRLLSAISDLNPQPPFPPPPSGPPNSPNGPPPGGPRGGGAPPFPPPGQSPPLPPHSTAMLVFGILAQLLINLQGLVNAMIYGGVLQSSSSSDHPSHESPKRSVSDDRLPSVYLEEGSHASRNISSTTMPGISIFASTFNMAEGPMPPDDHLRAWIPPGHDVYVIGVQECLNLAAMRVKLLLHLHATNGKVYVEYGREIGRTDTKLGYHGFIAITVYVRAEDVEAGHFHMHVEAISKVNRGKNLLGLGRASNKGAVGFAFRYFDTTFAVVTCHLASDSTGKSKVKKRHQDGTSILSDMHLQAIDNEFDCHLMAHHTIFLGDLNYRLTAQDASPTCILNMITAVVNNTRRHISVERGRVFAHDQLNDHYRQLRVDTGDASDVYMLTRTPSAAPVERDVEADHPPPNPISSMVSDPSPVELLTYKSLLEHDELKRSMDDGTVFYDFDEARISFAPTYRRVLGTTMDPTLSWTVDQVAQLYTTSLGDGKVRVPSFTDRILYHSLPGLRDRLACVQYSSAEFVGTSDHKPVYCIFDVLVDRHPKPATPQCDRFSPPLPKELRQLKFVTVHLTSLHVQWLEAAMMGGGRTASIDDSDDESESAMGTPSSAMTTTTTRLKATSQDSPSSSEVSWPLMLKASSTTTTTLDDGLYVRSVFPLPCEDDFAEERKLAELADTLLHNSCSAKRRLKSTWKQSPWTRVVESGGLKQSAVLAPKKHLHMALKFLCPSGKVVGQAIVNVADASLGYQLGRKLDFCTAVTAGGCRKGVLSGRVCVVIDKV